MFQTHSSSGVSNLNSTIDSRILIYEKDGSSLKPIKIYFDSNGKKWVEARNNSKFIIEIKNNTYETSLGVVSVDGLNVINAERAELKPENGYVLDSQSSTKINGWRTSLKEVREFVFTFNKADSYSSKIGAEESNIGVIGLAFFKEKYKLNYTYTTTATTWPPQNASWTTTSAGDLKSRDYSTYGVTVNNCSATTANYSSSPVLRSCFSAGTAQGEAKADKVTTVQKEFLDIPWCTDTIYYDTRENLIASGVIKEEKQGLPEPFAISGFCPVV